MLLIEEHEAVETGDARPPLLSEIISRMGSFRLRPWDSAIPHHGGDPTPGSLRADLWAGWGASEPEEQQLWRIGGHGRAGQLTSFWLE